MNEEMKAAAAEEVKAEETKAEETKTEESKAGEADAETVEVKAEESGTEEGKTEESKSAEAAAEESETKEAEAGEKKPAEAAAGESKTEKTKPEGKKEETMADYSKELEASYKDFDERHSGSYQEPEGPDAEKWANLEQMRQDKTVTKVKIKEAVKAGVIAYIDDIQGFIPASQISTKYIEKLEDMVGQYLEVVPITVDLAKKRLVLSGRVVEKEKEEMEKAAKLAAIKVGEVVEGVVDGIKDYGAFVKLDSGLSGLVHVSQISREHVKHPSAVLKEGQRVTAKVIKTDNGKISLSMKALAPNEVKTDEVFNYKESGAAVTGLGSLLKNIVLTDD